MRYVKGIRRRVRRFFAQSPYPQIVVLSDITTTPIRFRIHSDTERYRTVAYGGEREQVALFASQLQANDVVYDIGASIGLMSLIAAVSCSEGQVIAFEPDPGILERLHENIRLNDIHNISTKPYVVSNENGTVNLFTAGSDNVSPSLTGSNVKGLDLKAIPVEGFMLDTLIEQQNLTVPTVLKIDVEGAEYNVIQGAEKLLSGTFGKQPRFIFLEAHPDFLRDYDVTLDDLLDKIKSYGYRIAHQYDRDDQHHYFFTP